MWRLTIQEIPVIVEPLERHGDLEHLIQSRSYFRHEDMFNNRTGVQRRMMHIITPAFPQMNTTFNVSESQLKIIEDSLLEGFKILKLISLGELSWEDLLLEYPFFHDYDHFIEIEILSKDEKEFFKWKGLIQARLRYLVTSIESEVGSRLNLHLWPQEFDVYFEQESDFKYASFIYIGIKLARHSQEIFDLTQIVSQWRSSVYEQWDDLSSDNRIYLFSKLKPDLDTFVYLKKDKGFYKYEGKRILFPQEPQSMNSIGFTPDRHFYPNPNMYQMGIPQMNGLMMGYQQFPVGNLMQQQFMQGPQKYDEKVQNK